MSTQNYQNHMRKAPAPFYIGILFGVLGFLNCISILIQSRSNLDAFNGVQLVISAMLSISLVIAIFFSRYFALIAQDRAIRAEENLRHFVLTGKLLNHGLSIKQIIALRFASDQEFVSLAERALKENMTGKQIKQAIQQWRADEYRV